MVRATLYLIVALVFILPAGGLTGAPALANAESEINKGNAAFNQRNYTKAITHFSNALRLGKISQNRRAYVYLRRGRAYFFTNKYQLAANDHRQAIRLNSQYYTAYWYLGIDLERLKRYGEAVDAYSQAVRIKPDLYQAYVDRGNSFLYLNEYREALKDYETAIAIRPNYAIGWNNRGVAYSRLGNTAEAARSYRKALQYDPNYRLARENLRKLEGNQ